jgi:hypothetical protein
VRVRDLLFDHLVGADERACGRPTAEVSAVASAVRRNGLPPPVERFQPIAGRWAVIPHECSHNDPGDAPSRRGFDRLVVAHGQLHLEDAARARQRTLIGRGEGVGKNKQSRSRWRLVHETGFKNVETLEIFAA